MLSDTSMTSSVRARVARLAPNYPKATNFFPPFMKNFARIPGKGMVKCYLRCGQ